MAKLPKKELEEILVATLTGMTVDEFTAEVRPWLEKATHPRFKRHYNELTYLPMLEVMRLFRDNGYKTLLRHRRRPGLRARLLGS